MKQYPKVGKYS